MITILEFMFSGPFKFLGCFFILLLVLALIEGAISNICKTIMTVNALKYNKKLDTSVKNNINNIISRDEKE